MVLKLENAMVQNVLVGIICFCCPGMFNTLNGIGGGGLKDSSVIAAANTALYACFSIFGVFGGAITNILTPKYSMFFGSLAYVLFSCSLMAYHYIQSKAFVVFSGAVLGIGAGIFWTAQGSLMLAYPTEKEKGKYISVFWVIFNLGGMLGGILSFGLNYTNTGAEANLATYIAFIVIMCIGSLCCLLLKQPQDVIKSDGSKVQVQDHTKLKSELVGILKVFQNWKMLLLIPIFLSSNWFYTYQFNGYNGVLFDLRTRGLNNAVYWGSQMLGSVFLGYILDCKSLKRKSKALLTLALTTVVMCAVWGGAIPVQMTYSRQNKPAVAELISFKQIKYIGPFILYIFFGFSDAIIQNWSYWIMGALTNNSSVLARYSGFYKGIQSAGAAVSWAIDEAGVEYMVQLIVCWVLYMVSVLPSAVVSLSINDKSDSSVKDAYNQDDENDTSIKEK